jgi:hypothetical protein
MNSISFEAPPRVLLDTTVLCGALRVDGLQRQIIRLARASVFFTPLVSNVTSF